MPTSDAATYRVGCLDLPAIPPSHLDFLSMMNTTVIRAFLVAVLAATAFPTPLPAQTSAENQVEITKADGKAIVTLGGQPFTEYVFAGHAKPILYPVIGPHGIAMTRDYPMQEGVDNEASDHPHHKSLWYTHDDVNGVQFWMEYPGKNSDLKPGRIVQTSLRIDEDRIQTEDDWIAPDGNIVCKDTRLLRFGATPNARYIDFEITLRATQGDVTFGDTKEGTMGLRTHPMLRLQTDEKRGNHTAKGNAINSEGVRGKEIWGKRAKWVDYWAPIDGHTVGIAIFDHPSNPRHPTWWHARTYGLVAANPFGIHDFEQKPKGTGDMTIKSDESVTFRYRFLFHEGDHEQADIDGEFESFAETPAAEPIKVGIIGLDTSHAIAFTKLLNDENAPPELANCHIVAAYPQGSPDIESSTKRVPAYTEEIQKYGVKIVPSIEALLAEVDVVLLETNDGRPHLEQVRPVLKAGKPVFIDKPIAGSLQDAVQIFREAKQAGVPIFSSSSLRYGKNTQAARDGAFGRIQSCETHSPASLEPTHPDLFWYGIHGVESLFTVMGTGCQSVQRTSEDGKIVVTGKWDGDRVGIFREGKGYGGHAIGDKGEGDVGSYDSYRPLVVEIVRFFRTGKPPVQADETLEIYAFMEAADESKRQGGAEVELASVMP